MSLQQVASRTSSFVRPALFLAVLPMIGVTPLSSPCAWGADPVFTLVERSIVQDQGSWQVDYRLRYEGASGILVTPNEILARVEGDVAIRPGDRIGLVIDRAACHLFGADGNAVRRA